jgi:UDP-3-O-[3-hydroxymyristoyl] N-acetylglucosamine deacetylase
MFNYQKTLGNKVSCVGVGLHTGIMINLSLSPGAENTGVVFIRTDIKDKNNRVEACYKNVSNTLLGTTLCNESGVMVATIEHLMAALWGCGIDNCVVELDGPEIPIMDGSSEPFVFLIECAGVIEQGKTRKVIEVLKEVRVSEGDGADSGYISISPAEGFSVGLEIDFGDSVISNQKVTFDARDVSFKSDLCRARTFGFEHEVDMLRSKGLAKGGSLENAIVVGKDGVLNKDGLRYSNEFVRHKVLDCIGDVYLAGGHLKGHLHGFKSGHALNNKLLHKFFEDTDAWRIVQANDIEKIAH